MKNVFRMCKTYPKNKNYLVEIIGLKLQYVIYGSTTLVITNLICLANIPIPDLKIYHLEQSLTAGFFHHWSTGLTKRKLPMQCTKSMEVYTKEAWKPSLYLITLTGGSVAYSSYRSSSFSKQLLFIPFHFSHMYEIARLWQSG